MSWDYQEYTREDIEALTEWPCQDLLGGRMPFADRNYCQHPQCHPRNSPEYVKGTKTMSDDKTITIPAEEYKELVAAQNFLRGLRDCGVDNWIASYGEAQELLEDY